MKLLVVGSRSITDFDLSPYITEDVDTIISGGAGGVIAWRKNMLICTVFLNISCALDMTCTDASRLLNATSKWLV